MNIMRIDPSRHNGELVAVSSRCRRRHGRKREIRQVLGFEPLEARALLSGLPITATPIKIIPPSGIRPYVSGPYGLSPSQIRGVYGFNTVSFGSVAGDGSGQTIAIIDAFNEPTIVADLHAFDKQFSLPDPPSFKVVAQDGSSKLPAADAPGGWGVEIALDVEWAHAMAPGANILLVEANSASDDLYTAVDYARNAPGVSAISMSWGLNEFSGENSYDSHFTTPSGHNGVTFLAATGDSGRPGTYPAYSPNVLAVGGTQFSSTINANADYPGEAGWTLSGGWGGGGGISTQEAQPTYQNGVVTQSKTARTIPDVAFDAKNGVSVFDSYDGGSTTPWMEIGGTSLATPCWAGLIAVADQGLALLGQGTLANNAAMTLLYADARINGSSDGFHDITSGNNGFQAGPGYDLVTGIGTPEVNVVVGVLDNRSLQTTPPPLATPTSISPSGAVTTSAPIFQWSSVDGATSYGIRINDTTGGGSTTVISVQHLSGTQFIPSTPLIDGHSYTWQVQAQNIAGLQSGWSSLKAFNVAFGTISGTVFLDINGNGLLNSNDPGLGGRVVFADLHGDGIFHSDDPFAVTDPAGKFSLPLAPSSYTIRLLTFKGDRVTTPGSGVFNLSLALGQTVTGELFGVRTGGVVSAVPMFARPFGPTPNLNVNTAIVRGLYNLVLGQPADAAGLAYWTGQLQAGVSAGQMAVYLYASAAYDSRVATSDYQMFLGRAGTSAEVSAWVARMQTGWTETQVASAFLSSPEFNVLHPDNTDFIQVLYGDILDRQAGTAELAACTQALASGLSRSQLAMVLISAPEAAVLTVSSDYVAFLGRSATPAEVNAWVSAYVSGGFTLDEIGARILGSAEFYARALATV
jgi:hypothetical protein